MSSSSQAPSLLLLPAPPRPPTRPSLSAAYEAPLTAVLSKLKASPNPESSPLVVALACPLLSGVAHRVKRLGWIAAQELLAGLYGIIAVVCAREGIASDIGSGIDIRIVLVDHERGKTYHPDFEGAYKPNCTPVLDLAAFAADVRPWKTVYHINSEEGYDLLNFYLKFAEGKQPLLQQQLVVVEGGISLTTEEQSSREDIDGYESVCLGGTFDHLHPGHKLLIHATVLLLKVPEKDSGKTCELIVGISGDELLTNKKYAEELQPWTERATNVLSFLHTLLNFNTTASPATASHPEEMVAMMRDGTVRVRCVNIHDPFGPTISEEGIQAICVSGETRSGGSAINERRKEKGWEELDVYEIDVLDASEVVSDKTKGETGVPEDFSAKISSTAIRKAKAEERAK